MRPLFNDGQMKRAKAIAEQLRNADYDVIVFQEAFLKKARKVIWEELKNAYPNQIGPGDKGFIKTSNGLWILSKFEFLKTDNIEFKDCKVGDCMAKKGAYIIEIKKDGQLFQIVGTHLQAEEGEKCQKVRELQYQQIKTEFLDQNYQEGVPQLVIGDLNTDITDEKSYAKMLSSFGTEDGLVNSGTLCPASTWGAHENDMFKNKKYRVPQLLDYILIRSNGMMIKSVERNLKIIRQLWKKEKHDLSDHYAIEAIINF